MPAQEQQPGNTLSSIVSNLVRAAIGGNHQDVPDQDLDKYVADMIMKSANTADKKYKAVGLDAYTGDGIDSKDKAKLASGTVVHREDSNGLKTNKRFLSSIIKNTDEHNQALIRAEEKRAADVARELIADLDKRKADRQQTFDRGWDRRRREDERSTKIPIDLKVQVQITLIVSSVKIKSGHSRTWLTEI
ncbi:hypothetical protein BG011_006775 [Mortierella polycephala]|uniref:Uncharacterized protein n=1 Tax=Mortierella polycephala TaxID=41804 RepID=A0A9P6UA86_9FUNG|nr:hypothetical protein BG011_006775 [Mortierella polycephala]